MNPFKIIIADGQSFEFVAIGILKVISSPSHGKLIKNSGFNIFLPNKPANMPFSSLNIIKIRVLKQVMAKGTMITLQRMSNYR